MSTIKIKTAFLYKSLNVVIVGGEMVGSFKEGDVLYDIDSPNESYSVKGVALMKLSNASGSAVDIQLNAGEYDEKDLIGKTLTTEKATN